MYIHDNVSLTPLIMRNISDKFVDEIKTHVLCSVTFFLKILPFVT